MHSNYSCNTTRKCICDFGWRWCLHISIQIFKMRQTTSKFWDMSSFYSTNKLDWLFVL